MPTKEELRSTKAAILAGMETGNINHARTVLTEFASLFPDAAASISLDIINTYGIVLL